MPTSPSMQDQVSFITGVKADGTLTPVSYWGWNKDNPATYNTKWTRAAKFGASTAGTSGGTVTYYFDPKSNWSAAEKAQLTSGLALWAAVANIKFVETTTANQGQISFTRGKDSGAYTSTIFSASAGACQNGGSTLGTIVSAPITIDTSNPCFAFGGGVSSYGGYAVETMLHEMGHALGFGHSGAYNGAVNAYTQQFSAYDTRQWTIMSYINGGAGAKYSSQNPVTGTNWNGHYPTTWMPLDVLAIQQLYGVAQDTPLDGGEVFGFNCNIDPSIRQYFDFTVNKTPVITIWDKGTGNTLDLSGFTSTAKVNLNAGTFSSCAGMTNNIAIAYDTAVDKLVCSNGATTVTCNNNGDTVVGGKGNDCFTGGTGNDFFDGGAGADSAKYAGLFSAYSITVEADGSITIASSTAGRDTLKNVETLVFSDKSVATTSLSAPPATTPPPASPPASGQPLSQRDFNGDGKGDILLAINVNNSVQVWTMNGTTRVAATTLTAPNSNYTVSMTGDFNGDGKSDILWQNPTTNALTLWTMNGTAKAASTTLTTPAAGWRATTTGDVDGDGKADVVFSNGTQVQIWLMNGSSVKSAATVSSAAPANAKILAANDFNGDSKADILWQNTTTGALEIWQMDGTTVAKDSVLANGANWRAITTGDFNGDGKADILLQDSGTGESKILLMDGANVLSGSGSVAKNLGTAWKACGAADYNGDGFDDILFRNSSTGQYQTIAMSGTTVLSANVLSVNPGTSWHAVA